MQQKDALVAKRRSESPVDTDEIVALATAAGYTVADTVTQVRHEDPGLYFGAGKVDAIAAMVGSNEISTVIVDGELTPAQHRNIAERLPDETRLIDRIRLILDIFADQATDTRAKLQVEREQLRYELSRYEAAPDEGWFNRRTEKGSPRYDLLDRIDRLKQKLEETPHPGVRMRRQRREQGFDLVTIAGYTNAGKSTLLHRLADDLELSAHDDHHQDTSATAAIEDRLFKTLETTTRRVTIRGRPVLCTDTVGYVEALPHRLIASFSETLSEAASADVVLLVTDGSDEPDRYRDKLQVSIDVLDEQGVDRSRVIPVINKIDRIDERTLRERKALTTGALCEPVAISARDGRHIDRLLQRIYEHLPVDRRVLELPNEAAAMSLVSEAYETMAVNDVTYEGDTIRLDVEGRPSVIDTFEARVQ